MNDTAAIQKICTFGIIPVLMNFFENSVPNYLISCKKQKRSCAKDRTDWVNSESGAVRNGGVLAEEDELVDLLAGHILPP